MILEPYTITNPRAVMIHPEDTSVANGTVVSSWRSKRSAWKAVSPLTEPQSVRWEFFPDCIFNVKPTIWVHCHNFLLCKHMSRNIIEFNIHRIIKTDKRLIFVIAAHHVISSEIVKFMLAIESHIISTKLVQRCVAFMRQWVLVFQR